MAVAAAVAVAAQPVAQGAAAPRSEQLELSSFTVSVQPGDAAAGHCDASRAGACGYLMIETVFTGLTNFTHPAETAHSAGDLHGPIEVTRNYGCENARGKRLHRFDAKVSTTEGLTNYRGGGITIPATGDTITHYSYVFLDDRLPTDCPAGTAPRLYKITAGKARLSLEFRIPGLPDGTYKASDRAGWTAGA